MGRIQTKNFNNIPKWAYGDDEEDLSDICLGVDSIFEVECTNIKKALIEDFIGDFSRGRSITCIMPIGDLRNE